jgi:hypothetical protein
LRRLTSEDRNSHFRKLINLIYEDSLDSSRWLDFLLPSCGRLNSHTGLIWANDFSIHTIDAALSGQDIFTHVGFDDAA